MIIEKEISFLRKIKDDIEEGGCASVSEADGDKFMIILIKDAIRRKVMENHEQKEKKKLTKTHE